MARDTTEAEALHTAELFLEREEENCRLVEQVRHRVEDLDTLGIFIYASLPSLICSIEEIKIMYSDI